MEDRLRPSEARVLADDAWAISDIVLWELASLTRRGEIAPILDLPRFNRRLREITVWPITREVAKAVLSLDFRSDPADQIIAATSIAHDIPLLTRDTKILGSKIVPLALK